MAALDRPMEDVPEDEFERIRGKTVELPKSDDFAGGAFPASSIGVTVPRSPAPDARARGGSRSNESPSVRECREV